MDSVTERNCRRRRLNVGRKHSRRRGAERGIYRLSTLRERARTRAEITRFGTIQPKSVVLFGICKCEYTTCFVQIRRRLVSRYIS